MRVSAISAPAFRSAKPPAFRNSVDCFVLIGIGPDKQCPMKLQRVPFNGPRSTPVAALRATEKRSTPTSLNEQEQTLVTSQRSDWTIVKRMMAIDTRARA